MSTHDTTISLLGLAFVFAGCSFAIPGWLLNRSDTSRRFLHRMAADWCWAVALLGWSNANHGFLRVSDYVIAALLLWSATTAYTKAERLRKIERARPWLRDRR